MAPSGGFGLKILHEHAEAIIDIVLLHGLTGDRERTWTSPSTGKCWPRDFLPSDLAGIRVLTFGYDAYITKLGRVAKNSLRAHSTVLLSTLASHRQPPGLEKKPIIFIAHSLGGSLCKDALLSESSPEPHLKAISADTRAMLFVASPHEGNRLAEWARIPANLLDVV